MYKEIMKAIKSHDKIIVIRHFNPDDDAYGSQFGLTLSLRQKFPEKRILMDGDDNQSNFFNIPMDSVNDDDYHDALVILVDQSSLSMLRDEKFRLADKLVIIDHHESKPDFGDYVVIKPEYSSASELVSEFLTEEKILIPKLAADALYIGMVGDSNRFLYKGTTANTFLMAAKLIDSGADINSDYKLMSRDEEENSRRFRGYILSFFKIDGKVAYNVIDRKTREAYGVDAFSSSRGSVNLLSGIVGVEAFANFTEADTGEIYTELRSRSISIVDVAKSFGGGGHELACGCSLKSMAQVPDVIKALNDVVNV